MGLQRSRDRDYASNSEGLEWRNKRSSRRCRICLQAPVLDASSVFWKAVGSSRKPRSAEAQPPLSDSISVICDTGPFSSWIGIQRNSSFSSPWRDETSVCRDCPVRSAQYQIWSKNIMAITVPHCLHFAMGYEMDCFGEEMNLHRLK